MALKKRNVRFLATHWVPEATAMDAPRRRMNDLRRRADAICRTILTEDYPDVDIAIARQRLREFVEEEFPDRLALFEWVYESRFDRLIEQFRGESASL